MADNTKYDIAKSFQRTGNFPLDRTSVFNSLENATAYAEGTGPLGKTSYLGQIVAVVDGANNVEVYKIGYDSSLGKRILMEIGQTGSTIIERSITIGSRNIPVGTDMTSAFEIAAAVIDDIGSMDGKITQDIVVDNVTYAVSGTPITDVLVDVYGKIIHNSGVVSKDIEDSDGNVIIESGDTNTEAFEKVVDRYEKLTKDAETIREDVEDGDGNVVIESGDTNTEAFGKIVDRYDKLSKDAETVREDIEDGEGNVVVESGDTNTEAFGKLVDYMSNLSPNLEFVGDGDIDVSASGNIVTICVKGISNVSAITLDEKRTVTLSFNLNGGTGTFDSISASTWGDTVDFEIPSNQPTKTGSEFSGWRIDTDASGEERASIYQAGETVTIENLMEISGFSFNAEAVAVWIEI